jgi:hypothetical protein
VSRLRSCPGPITDVQLKLPEFMFALENYNRDASAAQAVRASSPPQSQVAPTSPERSSSRASSQASHAPGKLRYAAYEAPKPTARMRRVPSSSSVAKSDTSRFVGQEREDPLSRTITAGELALATEQIELQALTKVCRVWDYGCVYFNQSTSSLVAETTCSSHHFAACTCPDWQC